MPLTPDDILQQTFKERFKGYDVAEVDAFLELVMASLAELHAERDELAQRLADREEDPSSSDLLTRTLLTAQRAADDTLAQAQEEAERILADSRAEAARLVDEAQQRSAVERDRLEAEAARVSRAAESLVHFRTEYRARVQAVIAEQLALLEQAGELPDVPPEIAGLATFGATGPAPTPAPTETPESVLQALTRATSEDAAAHGVEEDGEEDAPWRADDERVGEP